MLRGPSLFWLGLWQVAGQHDALPLAADVAQKFAALAAESIARRERMEAADTLPFEDWRTQYLSLERLRPKPLRDRP